MSALEHEPVDGQAIAERLRMSAESAAEQLRLEHLRSLVEIPDDDQARSQFHDGYEDGRQFAATLAELPALRQAYQSLRQRIRPADGYPDLHAALVERIPEFGFPMMQIGFVYALAQAWLAVEPLVGDLTGADRRR
jgi:hypothetical protein